MVTMKHCIVTPKKYRFITGILPKNKKIEGPMELDLNSTKEGKVLGQILDVMQEMTAYVTDLQTQVDELTEVCDLLDQDLNV